MKVSDKNVNKYSLLQYSILQIIVITLTGITLIIIGAFRTHQRWVWLLGATLLVELAIRLAVEMIWRKLRFGGGLERVLHKVEKVILDQILPFS